LAKVSEEAPLFDYKPGLTGLVQINRDKISGPEIREAFEAHYIKNQNLFLDLEILLKTLFK
jgi:lipopolysaccharide/colanic/teichoic acid biosynthesis glycosyltransferase